MYSPLKTNSFWEYFGYTEIGDALPGLTDDPSAIANGAGREISRVVASGKVKV